MSAPGDRQLVAWFRDRHVGLLREAGSVWAFDYDPAWVASPVGFDLAPGLPRAAGRIEDGGSRRPVQWFFDNLLPEEQARTLLAKEAQRTEADAFGLLEYYGAESAGALTLLPPGTQPDVGSLQPLMDAALSARIRNLPKVSLSAGAPKRMSMAGAQHKLPVVLLGGQLYEPTGAMPSTHILKPDNTEVDSYPHSVANEWFCMRLARTVGLPVPDISVRHVPEPVYLVERFDREGGWPDVQRRHVVDACQLLSLDRRFKYEQAAPETFVRLIEACRSKARTRQGLFRWAVFNALIGNGDAHLKNLSFFVTAAGIELAPYYDLVSTTSYSEPGAWGSKELSTRMGRALRFDELNRHEALEFGRAIGLPPSVSNHLLDGITGTISEAAAIEIARLETGESPVRDAGEQRQLRLIVRGVLRDMRERLR